MKKLFNKIKTNRSTVNCQLSIVTQSGFTIVELLLYMGIFSIVLTVLLQIFTMILSVYAESKATSGVDQDGKYILSRLTYDIRNASGITVPNAQELDLMNPDIKYTVNSDNDLINQNDNTQLNSVATKIENLSFTKLSNVLPSGQTAKDSVLIKYTVKSRIPREGGRYQSQDFETSVQLR